ncbi:hypothetical protein LSTR_LSTR011756 [Laodelphax striatellus]|uniref:Protein kinase domain-containing protein n=1 Tax=Laodelphax striatellus TaxID=195883 RepID=A0A482WLY6_LAOST|nr:hypothetical protein LSTR_LSTR011756 [Laodelphax striatellus]
MADVHEQAEVKNLYVNQKMIDVSADRLDGLRTQCATSAELTQQEIRTLEGKLIKLFSYQLVAKSKIPEDVLPSEMKLLPSIHQWLMVVGLGKEAIQVATFRKTRHENLVLFMGACMKPPRLAIVTSMCKGMTLYTHIHLCKDKFNMNKTTIVAQQISQGMGYLHARGIVHKDLKTKNIFLENGKVVITDFGLFSVTKLCFGNRMGDGLSIPPGWLCYLAPEIIRSLRAHQKPVDDELPFSKMSDVYAFGTVWYELLCGEWPFKSQPPESIIWQVGKGMKQTLANLQASRDVKDILMLCWSFRAVERPDFVQLLKTLEKLPKKRLARSPSHPIHLSRSAESVF